MHHNNAAVAIVANVFEKRRALERLLYKRYPFPISRFAYSAYAYIEKSRLNALDTVLADMKNDGNFGYVYFNARYGTRLRLLSLKHNETFWRNMLFIGIMCSRIPWHIAPKYIGHAVRRIYMNIGIIT